jgi:tryptophan-rich sensory protein
MVADHPFLFAFGICMLAALAEGILAGKGGIAFLESLRQPRFAPPTWAWYFIGVLFYLVCFFITARLLQIDSNTPARNLGIFLVVALLCLNAFFNFVLFRARNLLASFLLFIPYDLVALGLLTCLVALDMAAALTFVPYILYLTFATFWGYQLWRLNCITRHE